MTQLHRTLAVRPSKTLRPLSPQCRIKGSRQLRTNIILLIYSWHKYSVFPCYSTVYGATCMGSITIN